MGGECDLYFRSHFSKCRMLILEVSLPVATKGDGIKISNCRPSNGNDVRALRSEGKMYVH